MQLAVYAGGSDPGNLNIESLAKGAEQKNNRGRDRPATPVYRAHSRADVVAGYGIPSFTVGRHLQAHCLRL